MKRDKEIYYQNLKILGWDIEKQRKIAMEEMRERKKERSRTYAKIYYETHKEEQRKRIDKFNKLHPNYIKKYFSTKRGKSNHKKAQAIRSRKLGWILLFENPFNESEVIEYHHITDNNVIALPKDLHRQYLGKNHRENTMEIVKQIY